MQQFPNKLPTILSQAHLSSRLNQQNMPSKQVQSFQDLNKSNQNFDYEFTAVNYPCKRQLDNNSSDYIELNLGNKYEQFPYDFVSDSDDTTEPAESQEFTSSDNKSTQKIFKTEEETQQQEQKESKMIFDKLKIQEKNNNKNELLSKIGQQEQIVSARLDQRQQNIRSQGSKVNAVKQQQNVANDEFFPNIYFYQQQKYKQTSCRRMKRLLELSRSQLLHKLYPKIKTYIEIVNDIKDQVKEVYTLQQKMFDQMSNKWSAGK